MSTTPNFLTRNRPDASTRDGEFKDYSVGRWRFGVVEEQDAAKCLVRVRFQDYDNTLDQAPAPGDKPGVLSYWLFVLMPKTKFDKHYWLPDIGEVVACLMDYHDETGVVLGAIYSDVTPTPKDVSGAAPTVDLHEMKSKDGTIFQYDRNKHLLEGKFKDGTVMSYDADASVFHQDFKDGSKVTYDADQQTYVTQLADGSSFTVEANGAKIMIDTTGNVKIIAANGNILFTTDLHNTSLNEIISIFNAHVHGDPSEGDTTPPTTVIP